MSIDYEIPTVSISRGFGQLCRDDALRSIDINFDVLVRTLEDLGEYSADIERPPIEINVIPYKQKDGPNGLAMLTGEDDDQSAKREIHLPLFSTKKDSDGISVFIDPHQVNLTLLHELQHVVDFANPELFQEQRDWIEGLIQSYSRRRNIYLSAGYVASGLGIKEIMEGISSQDVHKLKRAVNYFDLARLLAVDLPEEETQEAFELKDFCSPFEIRAYQLQEDAMHNNSVPEIVSVSWGSPSIGIIEYMRDWHS